jgi:dihydrofolate reductase
MRRLTSIVACANNGAIGASNRLPWRVRSDMQFFRRTTLDQVVIMGRKTQQSLGGCLPRRNNVVVTHGFALFDSKVNCRSAGSIEEALVVADEITKKSQETYVVGGATMYEQFAPYVERYLITKIDKFVPDADTHFREEWLGDPSNWIVSLLEEGKADGDGNEADYKIYEYVSRESVLIRDKREAVFEQYKRRAKFNLLGSDGLDRAYA